VLGELRVNEDALEEFIATELRAAVSCSSTCRPHLQNGADRLLSMLNNTNRHAMCAWAIAISRLAMLP
jgi:hypothetical protein